MLPLLFAFATLQSTPARDIADGAAASAESSTLAAWITRWTARPASDRSALLARGAAAFYLYRFGDATALLTSAAGDTAATDDIARQARLGLARIAITRGSYAQANADLQWLQRTAALAADSATWAEALILRAGIARRVATTAAAEPLLDSADALGATRWPRIAASLYCRRAGGAGARGDIAAMRKLADAGLAAAHTARSRRLEAACQFVRATSFVRAGATDSVRAAMLLTVALQRASGDLAALAAAQQWRGFYSVQLGLHSAAGRMLTEAWTAARASGSVDAQSWTALTRAMLAMNLSDTRGATKWLSIADSLMTATGDGEGQRSVLRTRVGSAFVAGDTARGWRLLDELQRSARAAGDLTSLQGALATRAREAINAGDAEHARSAISALRTVQPARGFETSRRVLDGEVALLESRWDEAERAFDDALKGIGPSQHYFKHSVQMLRALARARAGQLDDAARDARDTEESHDRWRATIADSVLRQFTTRTERGGRSYRTELIGLLAASGRMEEALRLAESQRSRRLREQMADAQAWSGGTGGTSRKVLPTPGLAEIQRALPDERTAIVEYVAAHGRIASRAFAVTRRRAWQAAMPSMDEVSPILRRLLASLTDNRPIAGTARDLGRLLLDPLLPGLDSAGVTQLVIVADDALHLLPFDVLRLPDGRAVLERFDVSSMPSMAVAADLWGRARDSTPRRVIAYGDPRVAPTVAAALEVDGALPGARREVRAIADRLPGTVVRVGADASETRFKQELTVADASVVHLAVHGMVEAWDGRQAALVLAAGGGDDGLLYAGEVSALDLRAPLVVLSACRTDAGELVGGEGVTGLTTAFLQAGARTVITTSWRIPDRGVVPIMEQFYAGLASGQPIGAAMRQARLASLRRGDPPTLWAAFTVVGDATAPAFLR